MTFEEFLIGTAFVLAALLLAAFVLIDLPLVGLGLFLLFIFSGVRLHQQSESPDHEGRDGRDI